MHLFVMQFLSGVANGGIYAGLALALVMIYNTTSHVNFAQGELATFSTFVAWTLINWGMSYWLACVTTICLSFVLAAAIQHIIVRHFQHAPVLTVVIVFTGLLIIFNSLSGWVFGYTIKSFPSPVASAAWYGSSYLSAHEVFMIAVTFVMLALVFVFFRFTKLGLAMRAAAQNPLSSRLVGIRVQWLLAFGWGLAAAIGSVSGIIVAPLVFLDPNMMSGILIYAFAAALLGGINNPWGAVPGGLLVGIVESLAGAYLVGTELQLTIALVIIIGVVVVRPSGLFGRMAVTRV